MRNWMVSRSAAPSGAGAGAAASPVEHAAGLPPVLLLHGTRDCTVPLAQSQRMATAVRAAGGQVDLVTIPAGHAAWGFWAQGGPQDAVLAHLTRHLA